VPLGLIPKVLNAIDMILTFGKQFRMFDAVMLETSHIQCIVALPTRFNSPNTGTLPAALRPRLPLRVPPK